MGQREQKEEDFRAILAFSLGFHGERTIFVLRRFFRKVRIGPN
jgi:hypothetical protein